MGALTPAVAQAVLQMGIEAAQRSQHDQTNEAIATATAQQQVQHLTQVRRSDSEERARALKRALAAKRARFGASGVGLEGSSRSVLSGLVSEAAEQERAAHNQLQARVGTINTSLTGGRTRNLLESRQSLVRSGAGLVARGLNNHSLLD